MKIPCELVVWQLLPVIRKEVAKFLVNTHGWSQATVARELGVTDAAVSQYLKDKRGENSFVYCSPFYSEVEEAIRKSSDSISIGNTNFSDEVCNICLVMKRVGILSKIYEVELGCKPPECGCDSIIPE